MGLLYFYLYLYFNSVSCRLTLTCTVHMKGGLKGGLNMEKYFCTQAGHLVTRTWTKAKCVVSG